MTPPTKDDAAPPGTRTVSTALAPLRAPAAGGLPGFLGGAPRALPAVPADDHLLTPEEAAQADATAGAAWSANTRRIYTHHWRAFQAWCVGEGRQALPAAPATVVAYLNFRAQGLSLASLEQANGAIGWGHVTAGVDPPPTMAAAVKFTMKGLRALKGRRAAGAKRPITQDVLVSLLAQVDRATLHGLRDAALLLVGFNAALRRSELVAIDWEHLTDAPSGVALLIPRSKTDQEGRGHTVGFPQREDEPDLCPVRALAAWRRLGGQRTGPVFRRIQANGHVTDKRLLPAAVGTIVKHYAGAAGLPEEPFAGHSLRAGLVTEAYRQGVPEAQIMETTRHESATMLARYRREADPVRRGAAGALKTPTRKDK